MTALTANNIVVVPIRSGVGLRLGANIGYLKFTPTRDLEPVLSAAAASVRFRRSQPLAALGLESPPRPRNRAVAPGFRLTGGARW